MAVNLDKPHLWKENVAKSVDMYNDWFMKFAPAAYRETRIRTTVDVEATLKATKNLTDVSPALLRRNPGSLATLRMSTCPPLAVDRLVGLGGIAPSLVSAMEDGRLPPRMTESVLVSELQKIGSIIERMADPDIFVWLDRNEEATETEIYRAATIVADRLCGSVANPIIRNAQERRQLTAIGAWLAARGYRNLNTGHGLSVTQLPPRSFAFHLNVPVKLETGELVNIPVDAAVMPRSAHTGELPLLIEAKSAGDYTNTNKRRKEEAVKMTQLRQTYGAGVHFILFLCGYFDAGYLGYEASEGIDWVWEHNIEQLAQFGV